MDKILKKAYTDPSNPLSFGGLQRLKQIKYVTKKDLEKFSEEEPVYHKFKNIRKNFQRASVIYRGIDKHWSTDVMHLTKLAEYNDNVKYILVTIDAVSKFVWLKPLFTVTGIEVANKFEQIIIESFRLCEVLQSDSGPEYMNSNFSAICNFYNIKHFSNFSEKKAFFAERYIRQLAERIWRYLYINKTWRYIDKLQDFASSYNNRIHSKTGYKPVEVNMENEALIMTKLNKAIKKQKPKPKFKKNDFVRLAYMKQPFQKSYTQSFTDTTYIIDKVTKRPPTYIYTIKTKKTSQ